MTDLSALTMPKWGIEMTEGTLSEWKIAPGDWIEFEPCTRPDALRALAALRPHA